MACATLVLAACGGGGGGGSAPSVAPSTLSTAVGAWEDKTSLRTTLAALVLPSGAYWAFYDGTGGTAGFDQGTASALTNTFQASVAGCLNGFSTCNAASISATFDSSHLQGTRTWDASQISNSFALTPMLPSTFDTQHTAQISDIQPYTWTVTLSGPSNPATLLIQSNGQFSGSSGGCLYSGTLSPMGNFNAFTVTLTFGNAPCSQPGNTTGIAVAYHPTSSTTQMFIAVRDAGQHGWLFSATR